MKKVLNYLFQEQVTITRMEKVFIHLALLLAITKGAF